jgi:hypothetical protein
VPVALNFIAFQLVWFLSLQGAGSGRHWQGSLAFAIFLAAQLTGSTDRAAELRAAGAAALCGFVLDSGYVQAGLIEYRAALPLAGAAPYWIVVMWANFGLTLNSSLGWLRDYPRVAVVGSAIGGPLAYLAGFRLDAARLAAEPAVVYGALALAWAVAVPLLLRVVRRNPPPERR